MNPKHLKKALGEITSLTDSGMDESINAVAAKKAAAEAPPVVEGEEMVEEEAELRPDEVEELRALLAQMGG